MNILAIGAHGDDLEEFCGGTLALFAKQGHHVVMCVVTDGRGRPKGDPDQIVAIRRGEAQASAAVIGAESICPGIPDGGLRADDDTRHLFIETMRRVIPDLVITHPPDDYHPDHVAASLLTRQAAQVSRTANYRSVLAPIRKPMPVAYMDSELGIGFEPEDYVDISEVWELKVKMLMQHRSQHMAGPTYDPNYVVPPFEQAESLPIVRTGRIMSEFRGLACGVRYAEGFRWWRAASRIVPRRLLP